MNLRFSICIFFLSFQSEECFEIDKYELSIKFKETQMKLHPDIFVRFENEVKKKLIIFSKGNGDT